MILLVGGTGFIGKNLVQALRHQGRECTVVSRKPDEAFLQAHAPGTEALTLEQFHADPAAALFGCTAVIYLASSSTPGSNLDTPWREAHDNAEPLLRCLRAVQQHGPGAHFVSMSSGGTVYGQNTAQLLHEDLPLNPISPYGLGKQMMEAAVRFMATSQGLRTTILRPANPIGRWQKNRSQGVVGVLVRAAQTGVAFPMMGDGSAVRDYFDVADLCTAITAVIEQPEASIGRVFNVGSGQGHSVRDIVSLVEQAAGRAIRIEPVPARRTDVDRVVLDTSRIRQALSWAPQVSLEQSLENIWTFSTGAGQGG